MVALLDVNVLIARSDGAHKFHHQVRQWLRGGPGLALATCSITESGFLRVYGGPGYPGGPGSPAAAALDLAVLRDLPGHRFLNDNRSELEAGIDLRGVAPGNLTDLHLLALAVRHDAKFITLDSRIDPARVTGGTAALVVIPT